MNCRYPWFPDINALSVAVLSRTDTADPASVMYPLSQYVLQYPRLKMGIDLLPSVVELYQWLHTELTYAITYNEAAAISLGRLAKVTAKHHSPHVPAMCDQLKCKICFVLRICFFTVVLVFVVAFNSYVQLTGCTSSKRPCSLSDDTPLLHLLSYSTDNESGNDLLHCAILDVVIKICT